METYFAFFIKYLGVVGASSAGERIPLDQPEETTQEPSKPVQPVIIQRSLGSVSEPLTLETSGNFSGNVDKAGSFRRQDHMDFWLQWTIPQWEVSLVSANLKAKSVHNILFEDSSVSVDSQKYYTKWKFKTRSVGSQHVPSKEEGVSEVEPFPGRFINCQPDMLKTMYVYSPESASVEILGDEEEEEFDFSKKEGVSEVEPFPGRFINCQPDMLKTMYVYSPECASVEILEDEEEEEFDFSKGVFNMTVTTAEYRNHLKKLIPHSNEKKSLIDVHNQPKSFLTEFDIELNPLDFFIETTALNDAAISSVQEIVAGTSIELNNEKKSLTDVHNQPQSLLTEFDIELNPLDFFIETTALNDAAISSVQEIVAGTSIELNNEKKSLIDVHNQPQSLLTEFDIELNPLDFFIETTALNDAAISSVQEIVAGTSIELNIIPDINLCISLQQLVFLHHLSKEAFDSSWKVSDSEVISLPLTPGISIDSGVEIASPIGETVPDDLVPDFMLVQINETSLTSQVENPLTRVLVSVPLYDEAAHHRMLGVPGSPVEDRQYQLQVTDLTVATGHWQDLVERNKPPPKQLLRTMNENPDLAWNTRKMDQEEPSEVVMVPMIHNFGAKLLLAPTMVYHKYFNDAAISSVQEIVAGTSIELNIISDINLCISLQPLVFLHHLSKEAFDSSWKVPDSEVISLPLTPGISIDSGVEIASPIGETVPDDLVPDFMLVQINETSLTSQVENPLTRVLVSVPLYDEAAYHRMLGVPGSPVEDRQYQLQVTDLTVATGHWQDLVERNKPPPKQLLRTMSENPDLAWNTRKMDQEEPSEVVMVPMIHNFGAKLLLAPTMVYHKYFNDAAISSVQEIVAGTSIELNIISDINLCISLQQLVFLHHLSKEAFDSSWKVSDSEVISLPLTPGISIDSGVEIASPELDKVEKMRNPSTDSAEPDDKSRTETNVLEVPIKLSQHNPSEIGYEGSEEESCQDTKIRSSVRLVPLISATLNQPHLFISLTIGQQKATFSLYNFLLACSPPGFHLPAKPAKKIPWQRDFPTTLVESRPGKPDIKSGILPPLLSLTFTDILSDLPFINVSFERPILFSGSMDKYEHMKVILPEIWRHFQQQGVRTVLKDPTSNTVEESQRNQIFKGLSFKSTQFVFAYNWKSSERNYGMKIGLGSSSGSINFESHSAGDVTVHTKLQIDRLGLTLLFGDLKHPLLTPFNFDISLKKRLPCVHLTSYVSLKVHFDIVDFHIGPHHLHIAKTLQQILNSLIPEEVEESLVQPRNEDENTNINTATETETDQEKENLSESEEEEVTVECELLFWSTALECFQVYQSFQLSESNVIHLDLPIVRDRRPCAVSTTWRVRLIDVDDEACVSPKSLISVLKVDSFPSEKLLPESELSIHFQALSVHLHYSGQSLEGDLVGLALDTAFRIIYSEMRKEISHITHAKSIHAYLKNNQLLGILSKGYKGLFSGKLSDGNKDWKAGFPHRRSHTHNLLSHIFLKAYQSRQPLLECYLMQYLQPFILSTVLPKTRLVH